MNNLFHVFKITVTGFVLDNKMFYEYSDYDNTSTTVPTDAQTLTKVKGFSRLKYIRNKLSELSVPVYCNIDFEAPGSASELPLTAIITVGYISIEPFLSTLSDYPDEDERYTAAASVLKSIVDDGLAGLIEDELAYVQYTYERPQFPGSSNSEVHRELVPVRIEVENSGVQSIVEPVNFSE